MTRKNKPTQPEPMPPTTAHRMAAWFSLAKPLSWVEPESIRFPPSPDDIHALRAAWQRRLADLRDNGVQELLKKSTFDIAMQCQPHAISYAGDGRPCRLRFCPFCSAQEAAFTYERVRRFVDKYPEAGLILGTRKLRIARGELHNPFDLIKERDEPTTDTYVKNLIVSGGGRGTIVKFSYLPHPNSNFGHKAILVGKVLAAVPFEQSQRIKNAGKNGEIDGESVPGSWDAHAVRTKSVPMARAVARLCEFPGYIFTSPAADVSKMLNETANVRCSIIRGKFRSPMPNNPRLFTKDHVPKKRGFGVATEEFGGCVEATEAVAAREFALAFGLEPADSFTAISTQTGVPMHWVGSMPPIEVVDLKRWGSKNVIYKFLKACPMLKGKGPFSHRVLVCSVRTYGICFFVTCDGGQIPLDTVPKLLNRSVFCFTLNLKQQSFWMIRITQLPGWQILLPRNPKEESTAAAGEPE